MKVLKIILNILLTFILMVGLLASTLLVIANNYANKENMLKMFDEVNLYNSVYEEVRDGFENYIYQSGLDIDIIDKICSREKVKQDIISVVNAMYGEGDSTIDSTEIRNNLDVAISQYIESQGRKLSTQEEENIAKFEDLIEESYNEEIGLYQKGSNEIARKLPQVLSSIRKAEIASVGVTALVLIILVALNAKSISTTGGYFGVAMLASGVIMIAIKNTILSKISIDELVVFTKSLSNALILIIKDILGAIQTYGIWYVVCGILIIIVMSAIPLIDKKS